MLAPISGVHFADPEGTPDAHKLRARELKPPQYPRQAVYMGGTGVVHLLLEIDPWGKVIESAVPQVYLTRAGTEEQMARIVPRWAVPCWRRPGGGPAGFPPKALMPPSRSGLCVHAGEFQPGSTSRSGRWEACIPGPHLVLDRYPRPGPADDIAMETIADGQPARVDGAGP